MSHSVYRILIICILLFGGLAGCATTASHPNDPFEEFNRNMFTLNKDLDAMVMKPMAEVYQTIAPEPVDKGVSNFFNNLDDIVVVFNDLMQFKFEQAASDSGRFLVNSTVGLLGFFDVATGMGLPKHNEDFGQTLGYWGIESSPYLVLPLLGPSTVRDTVGFGVDMWLDPTMYIDSKAATETNAVKFVDLRADLMSAEQVLDAAALDPYTFMRDAYLQRRNYLLHDGDPPQQHERTDELFEELFEDEPTPLKEETQ